ncbi:unnamed protein product [Heligmosomoides polygyrus]|uniref:G_PROTEIN_RECEP_F1_2 domain-containing protein n=1 Tax=Heligmosomoides polygyrus TaxID=6339 RepID=A0A3P7XKQ8_HELPZ|nr:unnamed protein product [Heligmosomoides polygyrus]
MASRTQKKEPLVRSLAPSKSVEMPIWCTSAGFSLLPSGPVLALLPVGPCRLFGPTTCFVAYNIGNGLCLNVALSVINTMYFRYRLIHTTQLSQARIRKNVMAAVVLIPYSLPKPGFQTAFSCRRIAGFLVWSDVARPINHACLAEEGSVIGYPYMTSLDVLNQFWKCFSLSLRLRTQLASTHLTHHQDVLIVFRISLYRVAHKSCNENIGV